MFRALLFKEWIKLRLYWTLLLVIHTGLVAYLCLKLRSTFELNDALAVWTNWIFKGWLFFRLCEYVPFIAGLLLACLQWLPEIQGKRLRLVLHLPLSETRAVAIHLFAGILLLTLALAPGVGLLAAISAKYFPVEFFINFAFVYAPWLLASYASYLVAAFTLIEPTWRMRCTCLLFGAALMSLFFFPAYYDSWSRLLPWLGALTLSLVLLPLFSARRFGKGCGL